MKNKKQYKILAIILGILAIGSLGVATLSASCSNPKIALQRAKQKAKDFVEKHKKDKTATTEVSSTSPAVTETKTEK